MACREPRRRTASSDGFTQAELLVVAILLASSTLIGIRLAHQSLAQERVESASRRIALGLEQGRLAASRSRSPCGLSLGSEGWQPPRDGSLPACAVLPLLNGEGIDRGEVRMEHNLPALVRFSSNGLVLDGGTVRVSAPGTELVRCLVMALPLGVVRLGRWQQGNCEPDEIL
jgi:hypothetical protein